MVNVLLWICAVICIRNELVYYTSIRAINRIPTWPTERYYALMAKYRERNYLLQIVDMRKWTVNQFYPFLKKEGV